MGSCAAPSAKGDDKFITTDYLQQCPIRDKDLAGRWHHRYEKRLQRPGGKGADDAERRSDVRSRFYLPWA
uniref:hypothetical protein n=1 Tax=Escherichia coli TaxID=562 RepID=UPI0008FFC6D7